METRSLSPSNEVGFCEIKPAAYANGRLESREWINVSANRKSLREILSSRRAMLLNAGEETFFICA